MISSQLNWIMFANFCKNLLTLQLKSIPHIRHMHHMWCRCQNFKPVVGRGQVLSLNICPAPPFTEHLVMFLKKWLPACYQWPTRSYILHPTCPCQQKPKWSWKWDSFCFCWLPPPHQQPIWNNWYWILAFPQQLQPLLMQPVPWVGLMPGRLDVSSWNPRWPQSVGLKLWNIVKNRYVVHTMYALAQTEFYLTLVYLGSKA